MSCVSRERSAGHAWRRRSQAAAKPIADEERLRRIAAFQEQFRDDIRTKDVGRNVLEKLTNEETAHRIFHEVAT